MNLTDWKSSLVRSGVAFARGLSADEVAAAEARYGVRFPPDLCELLSYALPHGADFPDWRDLESAEIRSALDAPLDGICFDIEHNGFWLKSWGPHPVDLTTAVQIASQRIRDAPRLIPLFGHRYLPDRPSLPGNPVFSVYQTDIICYGHDLEHYFRAEFPDQLASRALAAPDEVREIELWSRLAE